MNKSIQAKTFSFAVFLCMLAHSSSAHSNSVGLGIGITTEFPGSDDYQVIPQAAFELDTPIGILKNTERGAQLDLIKSGTVDTGPVVRINTGRSDSVSDDVVAALPEIEASAEAGWFIGSGFKLQRLGIDSNAIVIGQISAVTDVGDGHGGTIVNGSLGLVLPVSERLRFIPSVAFYYADDNYNQAFYGVSADSAATSELTQFNASGGLESTQIALVAIRGITERWSVTGVAAYNTLQEDAAQSPITQRGSDTQLFTGLVVNYKF